MPDESISGGLQGGVAVPEVAGLARAPRRECPRVEVDDHPVAGEVAEAHRRTGVIDEGEVGGGIADLEGHRELLVSGDGEPTASPGTGHRRGERLNGVIPGIGERRTKVFRKIIAIGLAGLLLGACGGDEPTDDESGLANPASVYCEEQGGTVDMREGDGGTFGVCVFPDGCGVRGVGLLRR